MKRKHYFTPLSLFLALIMCLSIIPFAPIQTKAADGITDFALRCYSIALQREPDPSGLQFWTDQIQDGQRTGSSVVFEFVNSPEYLGRNRNNQEYIDDMYYMFLGRKADPDGYTFWNNQMKNGMSRNTVFAGFANSEEFNKLCEGYGITAGYFTSDFDYLQVNSVNLFVERLYKTCLNRIGDQGGQAYWVNGLLHHELTGTQCAVNFIRSDEFVGLNLSNEDYVERLYAAFFGRKSDTAGKNFWVSGLKNGSFTRDTVLAGFAASEEFKGICESYAIVVGNFLPSESNVTNNTSGGNSNNTSGGNSNNTSGGNSNNTSGGNSNNTSNGGNSNNTTNGGSSNGSSASGSNSGSSNSNGSSNSGTSHQNVPMDADLVLYTPKFEGDMGGYMNSTYPNRMPKAVIIVPVNATKEETACAQFVQYYISEEDGYTPEICKDNISAGSKGYEISIGNTNRPHGQAKYNSSGSYSIKSYNNGLSITGQGTTGLINASFRFLEACGGYFFMSWDDGLATNQNQFQIDKVNGISIDYERPFYYTDSDVCYAQTGNDTGRLYSMVFGLNGFYQDSFCVGKDKPGRNSWYLTTGDRNVNYGFYPTNPGVPNGYCHTLLNEFLDPNKIDEYFDKHPEWFAAYDYSSAAELAKSDNERKRSKEQLCLFKAANDEELYGMLLQHCYDMIEASYDPNAEMQIISVVKGDNEKLCMCKNCMAHRSKYPNPCGAMNESYEMIELCNKLSADIHKGGKYKNLYIDTLAYTWTLDAPTGMEVDPYIIVRWAPIGRCYSHYLNAGIANDRTDEYYPKLQAWSECTDHLWIWDYNTNFRTTIAPFGNVDTMQHDIKMYYDMGIEGIYLQSNDSHLKCNTEFGDIRNYILARMLQDPTRDYQTELAFYTDVFYGESGKYVREYMQRIEKQSAYHQTEWEHRNEPNTCFQYMSETYASNRYSWSTRAYRMPDSEIEACENLWKKINAISANDTPEHQLRLKKLECSWRLVKSTLKVKEFSNASTYASENQKLIDDIKSVGTTVFAINQGVKMSECNRPDRTPDSWWSRPTAN